MDSVFRSLKTVNIIFEATSLAHLEGRQLPKSQRAGRIELASLICAGTATSKLNRQLREG